MSNRLDINSILGASFGETSDKLRVVFRKTINVGEYESEVYEISSEVVLDKELSGAERILVTALMQAQIEYQAYCNLGFKGLVTQTELNERKVELENSVTAIKAKAEGVLGKSLDDYIMFTELGENK